MAERKLVVQIIGDSASLERALGRSNKAVHTFGSSFAGVLRTTALAAGAGGFGALAVALKSGFNELQNAQKVSAQTAAALRSTGAVAGVTASHIDALSKSLLRKTGVDDEAIKSNANLLLTFTNIRDVAGKNNDIFDQATRAVLDLSQAFGRDGRTSAILLGKALNDPVKGLTALTRIGVRFTDQQKQQIAQLVKTGQVLSAQKTILAEVNRRVGDSAVAFGKTLPGQLRILHETIRNVEAELVARFSPAIIRVAKSLTGWLNDSRNVAKVQNAVRTAADAVVASVKALRSVFDTLKGPTKIVVDALGGFKRTMEAIILLKVAGRIESLGSAFSTLATNEKRAAVQASTLGSRLGSLPTKIVIGVTLATAVSGPLKKLLEEGLGATFPEVKKGAGQFQQKPGSRITDASGGVFIIGPDGKAYSPDQFTAKFGKHGAATRNTSRVVNAIKSAVTAKPPVIATTDVVKVAGLPTAKQIADQAKPLASAAVHAAAFIARAVKAQAARNQANQFRALGFGPTGEEIVPGIGNLQKQLASLTARLTTGGGLTDRLKAQLGRVRKVLTGEWGKTTVDSRKAINDLFQTIRQTLDSGVNKTTGPLTKFAKTSSKALLAGVGLSPEQLRVLRARFSQVGAGGSIPGSGVGAFGFAFPDIVVPVTLTVDGKKLANVTTRHQEKRSRRNPSQKRGQHRR